MPTYLYNFLNRLPLPVISERDRVAILAAIVGTLVMASILFPRKPRSDHDPRPSTADHAD